MSKVVIVKFSFDEEKWATFKEFYSDAEIRQILEEGGVGELSILMSNKLDDKELNND